MSPAQRAYIEDVSGAVFQRGVALGKWRVVKDGWPTPLIAIAAAERDGSLSEYVFRFDLEGYPARAPTSQIWDVAKEGPLDPSGRPWGSPNVQIAFRANWQPALYIPCDRLALESHRGWETKPGAWKPGHDITHYLNFVHDLLNSPGYTGKASASSPA